MSFGFPELARPHRRVMRAPVNPLDKSTVVSIFPKDIVEYKPTIQPGRFEISAGNIKKPTLMVVGPSSWWREIDEEQPLLEIPVSSIQIAESFVRDYCNGLLAFNGEDAAPGLFFIPGEHSLDDIKVKYTDALNAAEAKQRNWYAALIRIADGLWSRSNGNPLAISDDMRMAAKEMGHNDRDWMRDFKMTDNIRCSACGAIRNPAYPVCGTCRYIDQNHPMAKNMKFANQ